MLDYPAEIRPRLPLPRYKANVKQRELVVLLVILWLLLLAPFILYVSTPFLLFEGGREGFVRLPKVLESVLLFPLVLTSYRDSGQK